MRDTSSLRLLLHGPHNELGKLIGVLRLISFQDFQVVPEKLNCPGLSLQVNHRLTQTVTIFVSLYLLGRNIMRPINHHCAISVEVAQEIFTTALLALFLAGRLHFKIMRFRQGGRLKVPSGDRDKDSTVFPLGSIKEDLPSFLTPQALLLFSYRHLLCSNVPIIQRRTGRWQALNLPMDCQHSLGISVDWEKSKTWEIKIRRKTKGKNISQYFVMKMGESR